jgi:peptidyl-prolyl cis-trans isomerase SurA
MQMRAQIPKNTVAKVKRFCVALLLLLCCASATERLLQAQSEVAAASVEKQQLLDSVIAVVNNQVILTSDLDLEMRVFRLLPIGDRGDFTRPKALERLTTRALIEQQILQEDPHGLDILPKDVEDSLAELRQNLPACKLRDCTTASGWAAYLTTLGLNPDRVTEYWAHRMAVLRFIELRFRSGIRVTPEEIEKYYREELTPKYAKPGDAPALNKISPRIQEILLQQKVNALLGDWLKSLQDQGQVEILDPTLRAEVAPPPEKGSGP